MAPAIPAHAPCTHSPFLTTLIHTHTRPSYEQTQEDVAKWQPIVKRHREAEHVSFPLATGASAVGAGAAGVGTAASVTALAAKFQPSTSLERDLDAIMRQYGMDEKEIVRAQQLEMRKLDPEEVRA